VPSERKPFKTAHLSLPGRDTFPKSKKGEKSKKKGQKGEKKKATQHKVSSYSTDIANFVEKSFHG
jgi:hypothetical protein